MGTSLVARRELGTLRYEHSSRREGSKDVSVGYWRLEPQPPLKVGLQLIERRLVPRSTAARAAIALGDAAFGTKRVVAIRYAGPRPIGESALD
jgi:hypothetical protein